MAKETTIAQRTGISKRTQAYGNQNLSGDARLRSAIYNRASSLINAASTQEAPTNRILNAANNMLRRNHFG